MATSEWTPPYYGVSHRKTVPPLVRQMTIEIGEVGTRAYVLMVSGGFTPAKEEYFPGPADESAKRAKHWLDQQADHLK